MNATVLAVDLGSSSGRVVAGCLRGDSIEQVEIHRFAHEAEFRDGYLTWDVEAMWRDICEGLTKAIELFPDARSVSVDTWGVDWAPLDDAGNLVVLPRAYRDERTLRTHLAFQERLSDEAVWAATGIAPATINTANQMFAYMVEETDAAARTAQILWLPDYFVFRLSGVRGWSRSIASTGGLCSPGATGWAGEVFEVLDIPQHWVGSELTWEHTIAGSCTVPGLEQLLVVRGGAHDSACAVQALKGSGGADNFFLSSGSWSVLGVMRDQPLMSDEARKLGITNEARSDAGVRPLFNITGLWIMQEAQRQWEREGKEHRIVPLLEAAKRTPSLGKLINVDDPEYAQPGDMVGRICSALGENHLSEGQIVRVICESLAERYARGIQDLSALIGQPATQLNVMGGGSRNGLLCQLTADAAAVPVLAGPAEASALGAILGQLKTLGLLEEDHDDIIGDSARTTTFLPANG